MPDSRLRRTLSRRRLFRWTAGLGSVVGLALAGRADGAGEASTRLTVRRWQRTRRDPVLVAHRGSGDTYPEHTMPAYQAAFDWGAEALEVSVGVTSDGVLVCMHDATLDRTTNGTGRIDRQPWATVRDLRVVQPQLGGYWVRHPPRVPRLTEVLDRFGGEVILCLEAKNPDAYAPMMAAVVARELQESVVVKAHHTAAALALAGDAGYPRFAYFGTAAEVTTAGIAALAQRLDRSRDVLVIPAASGSTTHPYLDDALVRAAVGTGVPVWAFPIHRRSEARHFVDLGVAGLVCAGYGWVAGVVDRVRRDDWSAQRTAPGELPRTVDAAPTWTADGALALTVPGGPQFVMMGQFCPLPAAGYTLGVEVRWTEPTADGDDDDAVVVSFGHDDDRAFPGGGGTGYSVRLGAHGTLSLWLHQDGPDLRLASVDTDAVEVGDWTRLELVVNPDGITVERTDTGQQVSTADTSVRGGYVHLGRASGSGAAEFRRLATS